MRTLEELREALDGKIYLYLKDYNTRNVFIENAKKEGYRLENNIIPSNIGQLVSLENGKKFSFVGTVGNIAFFQTPKSVEGKFHRIDYAKYISGEDNYYYSDDDSDYYGVFTFKYHGTVMVIGENYINAIEYLKSCANDYINITLEDEDEVISEAETIYDVIIVEE